MSALSTPSPNVGVWEVPPQENTVSDAHYDEIAERYEDVLFYDPDSPYHRWLVGRALAHLALSPSHRLADIGGGAGA